MDTGCCAVQWKGVADPFVRLCYQFGMMLGVDEFTQDQGFHLTKHRLTQRLFVGFGLVWGGAVAIDATKGTLSVAPLFAVDELGRELWQKDTCSIDLAQWTVDNTAASKPIYLTLSYQACCISPVPAIAAPCDQAASPTMPSRVLEAAQCALSLDAPPGPIDLSRPFDPTNAPNMAANFATLVQMLSDDAGRPLLLGTVVVTQANTTSGASPRVTATFTANPLLPTLVIAAGATLRVVSATAAASSLAVTFSVAPSVLSAASFSLTQLVTGSPFGTLSELVDPAGTVTADASDARTIHVPLKSAVAVGTSYRLVVTGTGAHAVIAGSPNGPVALGNGSDFAVNLNP
jgi:hypothetical protein